MEGLTGLFVLLCATLIACLFRGGSREDTVLNASELDVSLDLELEDFLRPLDLERKGDLFLGVLQRLPSAARELLVPRLVRLVLGVSLTWWRRSAGEEAALTRASQLQQTHTHTPFAQSVQFSVKVSHEGKLIQTLRLLKSTHNYYERSNEKHDDVTL